MNKIATPTRRKRILPIVPGFMVFTMVFTIIGFMVLSVCYQPSPIDNPIKPNTSSTQTHLLTYSTSVSNSETNTHPTTTTHSTALEPCEIQTHLPASLLSDESGTSLEMGITLNRAPESDVQLSFSISDATEGSINKTSIIFTPSNWGVEQTIRISGVDDDAADGAQNYSLDFDASISLDTCFNSLAMDSINVVNQDNDGAAFSVVAVDTETNELGDTAEIQLSLSANPLSDVHLTFDTTHTDEGIPDVTSLVFTSTNWDSPQTITITGQSDDITDGDQTYSLTFDAATSTNSFYNNLTPDAIELTNVDANLASCAAVKTRFPDAEDGSYIMDLDGTGPILPVEIYCNMSVESGGWTLVMSENNGANGLDDFNASPTGTPLTDDYRASSRILNSMSFTELLWYNHPTNEYSVFSHKDGTSKTLIDVPSSEQNDFVYKLIAGESPSGSTQPHFNFISCDSWNPGPASPTPTFMLSGSDEYGDHYGGNTNGKLCNNWEGDETSWYYRFPGNLYPEFYHGNPWKENGHNNTWDISGKLQSLYIR